MLCYSVDSLVHVSCAAMHKCIIEKKKKKLYKIAIHSTKNQVFKTQEQDHYASVEW